MKKQILTLFIGFFFSLNLFSTHADFTIDPKFNNDPINKLSSVRSNNFFNIKSGVLGGVSYYFVNNNQLILNNNNNIPQYTFSIQNTEVGIHFGLFTQLFLGKLFLRPEITFNSNIINYKLDDFSNSTSSQILKERYQYLDIPILIGYKNGGLRFNAGPVGHIFLSNKSNLVNINQFSTDFKTLTLGYQVGIGFDFHNLMLDIRYEGNFSKIGEGILFYGQKIYFDNNPGRIMASISFAIK